MTYQCWSLEEADALDFDELLEGYRAGSQGGLKPAWPGNRTAAFVHGWYAGAMDFKRIKHEDAPWLAELARQYIQRQKEKKR